MSDLSHETITAVNQTTEGSTLEIEPVEVFLAARNLESLASHPVKTHDGTTVTLAEALAICGPARQSFDSTLTTIKEVGGEGVDVTAAMKRHVERMGDEAQNTSSATPDSKKK